MADITYPVAGGALKLLRDMGDGTWAEVTAAAGIETIGTRAYNWAGIATRAIGAASAASSAVGAAGEYEVSADVDCYILVGSAPTATTSSRYLPAGVPFTLQLGATDKVAVIHKTEDGNLTIMPVA